MTHRAVVQVPAFCEPEFGAVLDGIAHQRIPGGWDVEIEAWVTLDNEGNETWTIAKEHPAVVAREAPPGKLSARNAAHDAAFRRDSPREVSAVVTWDADAQAAHEGVLEALLPPLVGQDGVIATNGNPVTPGWGPVNVLARTAARIEQVALPHLNGQLSAFHRAAWIDAGPFRTDLDQTDVREVRGEEEFAFYRRLDAVGDVLEVRDAKVYETPRRPLWRVNKAFDGLSGGRYPLGDWGEGRGVDSFDAHGLER